MQEERKSWAQSAKLIQAMAEQLGLRQNEQGEIETLDDDDETEDGDDEKKANDQEECEPSQCEANGVCEANEMKGPCLRARPVPPTLAQLLGGFGGLGGMHPGGIIVTETRAAAAPASEVVEEEKEEKVEEKATTTPVSPD